MNIKFHEHRQQIYVQGQQCDVVPVCCCDYLWAGGGDFEEALDLITVPDSVERQRAEIAEEAGFWVWR